MQIFNNRVSSNFLWIIASRIVQSLINLVITIITSRYLGPSNYGLIGYAASFTAFFLPIAYLGINSTIVNELIKNPNEENRVLGSALCLSICSSFCCILSMAFLVVVLNPDEPVTFWVCVLYSLALLFNAMDLIVYWYQAHLKSKISSSVSISAFTLIAIYKTVLIITQQEIYWFAVSNAIDYLIISTALIFIYRRQTGNRLVVDRAFCRNLLKISYPYIFADLMVAVFAQTDRIMLKAMLNESAVGYYTAATTICGIIGFVFIAILDTARPIILSQKNVNEANFEDLLKRLYSVVIYFSLAVSAVTALLSRWIVPFLYGEQYLPAVGIVTVIVWYTTFSYIGPVRNIWILANGAQKHLFTINAVGAIANVLLNFFMIPVWGTIGAAIASLITQFFTNVVMGYIIKPIRRNNVLLVRSLDWKYLNIKPFLKHGIASQN